MTPTHVHWNKLVAEVHEHLYYACRCGDARSHGLKGRAKSRTPLDEEWLAGADRMPQ